jgi:hypothetical protein
VRLWLTAKPADACWGRRGGCEASLGLGVDIRDFGAPGAPHPTGPEFDLAPGVVLNGIRVGEVIAEVEWFRGPEPATMAPPARGLSPWTSQPSQRPADALSFRSASPLEGNGTMKRRIVVLLLTLLALVITAPSAQAAPPTHERLSADFDGVDETCGFPVEIHQTGFIIAIQWVDEDGSLRRIEAYPQLKAPFTNPATGESIRVNIAGPAHITESPDGSFTLVGTGNWIWGNHPQTGEPGTFLLSGRFVLSVDAQGNESFRSVGRFVDLCAELAA